MLNICAKEKCIGCEACSNICPKGCISFKQDNEGFFFPVIDKNQCVDCKLCQRVCPVNSTPKFHQSPQQVFAAWALDDEIRKSSSSGGLYSVFANYCLLHDGVVNGVYFNDELFAVHGLFNDFESVKACRGSKYVQSRPGTIYKQVKEQLKKGKTVFFTSTPCQVNALYSFLGSDYDNLYTCDFICHGVPSPQYLKTCLQKITSNAKNISKITFRDLSKWGNYRIKVVADGKEVQENVIANTYSTFFLSGLTCRYSCYTCPFAQAARVSDITLGDFWGIGKYFPFPYDTENGVSLVICHTPKGYKLLQKVRDQLFLQKRSLKEAARGNQQLNTHISLPFQRKSFYLDAENLSPNEMLAKYTVRTPLWKKIVHLPGRIWNKFYSTCMKILCMAVARYIKK